MQFTYKATNADGHVINGTADVGDRGALLTLLHKEGLSPILIKSGEKNRGKSLYDQIFKPSTKVKLSDLVIFTRQLSTMISAGVPLAKSMAALKDDTDNVYFKTVISGMTKDVESGKPLGDAFAKYPKIFSDIYVNMVRAGEEGGILDEILKRLANQVEQDSSMRKKIKSAMAYPLVIMVIMVIAFFAIMLYIMPQLQKVFANVGGPGYKLPVYTVALLKFSHFFAAPTILGPLNIPLLSKIPNIFLMTIVVLVGVFYGLKYIKTPKGKYRFHSLLLRTPVVKNIITKVAIARFSRVFASLMSAGVSVLDALEVTGAALGNRVIQEELKIAAEEVRNGKALSTQLQNSPHFPPIVAQMLSVGEETGQMDTVLVKIADFYEEEVTVLIDGLSAVIEPVMIVFLGAAVGLIAASVMGPIANLSKSIGNQS